jgi:hypothetical protein|tara:strand:+ start:1190 stop:1354 length:165 start_codon:yes stop_codon:yes gene_type:complete
MEINAWVLLASQVLVAAAVFGGIRSDLRHMMKNIQQLEVDVTNTNKRVDDLYKK